MRVSLRMGPTKRMQVQIAHRLLCIVKHAISPARNSVLALPDETELLEFRVLPFECLDVFDETQNVEYWLRLNAWDRRAADMVKLHLVRLQRRTDHGRYTPETGSPPCIVVS